MTSSQLLESSIKSSLLSIDQLRAEDDCRSRVIKSLISEACRQGVVPDGFEVTDKEIKKVLISYGRKLFDLCRRNFVGNHKIMVS